MNRRGSGRVGSAACCKNAFNRSSAGDQKPVASLEIGSYLCRVLGRLGYEVGYDVGNSKVYLSRGIRRRFQASEALDHTAEGEKLSAEKSPELTLVFLTT